MKIAHIALTTIAVLWLSAGGVSAACTSPAGNAGDVMFSSVSTVMVYCNGTNWINMGANQSIGFGALTSGDFCTATSGTAIACTTAAINLTSQVSGTLPVTSGGTGLSAVSTGDILYGSASSTLSRLAVGTNGYVLTLAGGVPTWAASTGGVTSFSAGTTGLTPSSVSTGAMVLAGTLGVANGGTGDTSLTSNVIYMGAGTSPMVASSLSDNGTNVSTIENIDATGASYITEISNDATTGTAAKLLAKLTSTGHAIETTTTDTDGIIGVVVGGAGTTGNAQIAVAGQAICTFDSRSAVGDYVAPSATVAGECHDAGATRPTGSQTIGRILYQNGRSTQYGVALSLNGTGGGVPAGTSGMVQFNNAGAFGGSANLTWDNTNYRLGIGTSAAPLSNLDLYGGVAVGASYAGVTAAPTNGAIIQGNVGIGTTGPNGIFQVNTAANQDFLLTSSYTVSGGVAVSAVNNANNANVPLEFHSSLTDFASGNVGIGTTSPGASLQITGTSYMSNTATNAAGIGLGVVSGANAPRISLDDGAGAASVIGNQWDIDNYNGTLRFFTAGIVDVTIGSSGNVGIGTTNPGGPLDVWFNPASTNGLYITPSSSSTANAPLIFHTSSGGVAGYVSYGASQASVVYNTSSDRRLKENITESTRGLDALSRIIVEDFNFIADTKKTRVQGFIAQDLYRVYPEAVTVGGSDPKKDPWAVDYGRTTPLIIKAVQELKVLFDGDHDAIVALKADNENLRTVNASEAAQIKVLTARLDTLEAARR